MPADLKHSDDHTFLPPHVSAYCCSVCALEVALQDELVSRSFQGTSGPAYLFRTAVNVDIGNKTTKQLLSGKHVISRESFSLVSLNRYFSERPVSFR